jgi:hypothetical protein
MVPKDTAALTEDILCQWNQLSSRVGASQRDPPGVLRINLYADGDCRSQYDGDNATPNGSTKSEDEQDDVHMIEAGDDEDDGLYIGAKSDDDSSIAFSDIVLPIEAEDPYLNELAAEAAARRLDLTEIDGPPMPPLVGAPNKVHVRQERKAPRPPPSSAHVIVAHAVARKKTELGNLSQKELLECLEKRLRPYMMLPRKLPLLRQRKRPNCLFLNHMGTRRPAPMPTKRKMHATTNIASTADVTDMTPLKKRILTAPQQGQMPTSTPSEHPTPVTAHSSPQRVGPRVAVETPYLLPKLLTDSLWDDYLVEQRQAPPKETTGPPLIPLANRKLAQLLPAKKDEAVKRINDPTRGNASEPRKRMTATKVRAAKTNKNAPMKTKEEEDAKRAEVFKVIQASMTAIPIQVSRARKAGGAADPPGTQPTSWDTSAPTVTPSVICKTATSESSISSKSPSQNEEQDEDAGEDASMGSSNIHEPLAPLLENSFQYGSLSPDHDMFSSLSDATFPFNGLGEEGHQEYQSPARRIFCRVQSRDFDGPYGGQRYQACVTTRSTLVGSKKPPLPSFVISEGPSSSTHQGSQPRRRIPMPRPILLLSPEMDIVSPRARYAYDSLAVTAEGDDASPSGGPLTPRRPVSRRTSPTKMQPHLSPDYDGANIFYSHRRPSLPYYSMPMERWLPASPSGGRAPASIVTPDAFTSPFTRSKLIQTRMVYNNNDMMEVQSHLQCPTMLTVHPSEGYHSPVSQRRTLSGLALHSERKDVKTAAGNNMGTGANGTCPESPRPTDSPKTNNPENLSQRAKPVTLNS